MILQNSLWISAVDHRISTALIFFLLLLLLGNGKRRTCFALRAALTLLSLCTASWGIRFCIDRFLFTAPLQGVGYSLHLAAMCLLYLVGYAACYEADLVTLGYVDIIALTIYKLAWNFFKVCASGVLATSMPNLWQPYSVMGSLVSYAVYAPICVLCCMLYRHLTRPLPADIPRRGMVFSVQLFLGCQIILEYCGHVFTADAMALFLYYLCALMYTVTNFIILLTVTNLAYYRRDNEDMRSFIRNKQQYYQMSYDGITSLQIKCHDLKHQIAAIRSEADKAKFDQHIARLEDSIIEYGTVVDCGNEALNIVLTEKNILCQTCGVKFSYIIDGTLFQFLPDMEIYTLFGNALDNALESCAKVADLARRVISLKAAARGEMVVLHVENCFEDEPNMVDGMPVTTKPDAGHGFGLRSIRQTAEKHGGIVSIQTENHIFKLTVLMNPHG